MKNGIHLSFYNKNNSRTYSVRKLLLIGAGEGNRTPVVSLGSWNSAIELHPPGDVEKQR